jgi:hypothetical protein
MVVKRSDFSNVIQVDCAVTVEGAEVVEIQAVSPGQNGKNRCGSRHTNDSK